MGFDTIIRGGTLVDGSGGAPYNADIGIRDGLITEIGSIGGSNGARIVDATGAIVTPGFVDLHTHYDGQVSWDSDLMPSVQHGVTTAVMGSCGVGFAPVHPEDRQKLIDLMEGVEDIPGAALAEGIQWNWTSFPEYMDALDRMPHTIDIAAQVPHDALRVFVMGQRALEQEEATAEDIVKMQSLLREAMQAGAAGFTTGRSDVHRSNSGAWTPASEATRAELNALASVLADLKSGVVQAVSDFDMERDQNRFDAEFDILEEFARSAGSQPFSLSLNQRDFWPDLWQRIMQRGEKAAKKGIAFRFQVAPRAIGVNLGLQCTFHPFMGKPSYKAISQLPLTERVKRMQDPQLKEKILAETSDRLAGDGTAVPPLADKLLAAIDKVAFKLFELGESPDYEQPMSRSLGAQAMAASRQPLDLVYDALLKDQGRALLYFPIYNYTEFSYNNVLTMMQHPLSLPGLSDGGAHVGTVCDASFPTYLLAYWTRDRSTERIPLERAVQMLSSDTATHMGYKDRGRLAAGFKADVNVIDYSNLKLKAPRMVKDLPAGGQRLLQDVEGYVATMVSGQLILEQGRLTGQRPGRVVRSA
ncbi:MAG: amidohydrolase family protein [Spirochaetales bacterium]|nr:amidohydrolase family protein [Spirochaetales bacterium]